MRRILFGGLLAVAVSSAALSACKTEGREQAGPDDGPGSGSGDPNQLGGSDGDPTTLPDGSAATLVPNRIRRLSNLEYEQSVRKMFPNTQVVFTDALAVDARQNDFTRNEAQRVDPVVAGQYQALAQQIAAEAVAGDLTALVPCAADATRDCAAQFIDTFASTAYRRPLTEEDKTALLTVYDVGAEGAAFKDGIELIIEAVLQSASFLYHQEIGEIADDGTYHLGQYEIANELAYLLTRKPPDADLLAAAAAGTLMDPAVRETHALRILSGADGEGALPQMQRFFIEWLGIDGVTNLAKNAEAYPDWGTQRFALLAETEGFINEVMVSEGSRLSALFGADYTYIPAQYADTLGAFYGVATPPAGRFTVPGGTRRGILTQPSFLARRAKENESAPVLRGVAVLRRVMCVTVPDPGALNLNVVPPAPDPTLTTRERFDIHQKDPACASCHEMIDGIGFTFENFDAIGKLRDSENGKPVDTSGFLDKGTDIDGTYANSTELATSIVGSDRVKECFARNFYRFATAQGDKAAEDTFVKGVWDLLDAEGKDNVGAILLAYIKSDLFVVRRAQ